MRESKRHQTYFGCLRPAQQGPHLPLRGSAVTVGRSPDCCRLIVSKKTVSRLHCLITLEADGVFIQDLESRNGTWVNGQNIQRLKISDGQTIHIGMEPFIVELSKPHTSSVL